MEGSLCLVVLLILALIIIITLCIGLYEKSTNAVCLSRRRLEAKTVIVTGGTAGIGLMLATDLAHRGARVIIACPFEYEGVEARAKIIEETENHDVIFKLLDLSSLESTRAFAMDILKTETRLDIMINNAGVGIPTDFRTKDGMNFIMQVNYYGAFLLTLLLLPLLKKTGKPGEPSRIVTTTSFLHMIGKVDIKKANEVNYWYKLQLYANSKLYLIYFANELTTRLRESNVVINNVDPGLVATRIYDSVNKVFGFVVSSLILILFKTPWQGAQTALHVAVDKSAGEVSGQYFRNCKIKRAIKRAYCIKTAKLIWEESVRLVGLSDDELEKCFKSM